MEKYEEIKEWNDGYIVVSAKYKHNVELEEEYIDLASILKKIYIDSDEFLKPIKKVRVLYDWSYNGDSVLQNAGCLNERDIRKIQDFIKKNYQDMYLKWANYSSEGFFEK